MMASTPRSLPILAAVDGVSAIAVRKVLLGKNLVQGGTLDQAILPVFHQFVHQQVGDAFADVLVRSKNLRTFVGQCRSRNS